MSWRWNRVLAVLVLGWLVILAVATEAAGPLTVYSTGIAKVDISPSPAFNVEGLGFRQARSDGKRPPIWSKAIAVSEGPQGEPVVLIAVDNFGISASVRDDVAKRLQKSASLKNERLFITSTHSHTGVPLTGMGTGLVGRALAADESRQIDQYTSNVIEKLEQVALSALKERRPSRLSWGIGSVGFAANRQKGGPVDHDLPMLAVKELDGKLRAVYVSYASHGESTSNNRLSGDWVGAAQDLIQDAFPSAEAIFSIGCSADQQPIQSGTAAKNDLSARHGAEIAAEVKRMLSGFLTPVEGGIATSWTKVSLNLADAPSKSQLEERAKGSGLVAFQSKLLLEQLSRGQTPASNIDYPIASCAFGDRLAFVFLPGEVSVDYSLRLKKELDGRRLWINGYSNDVACGVPSDKNLTRKGYDATEDLVEFNQPAPLKSGVEEKIIAAVRQQLDAQFAPPFDPNKTNGTLPKSPQQAAAMMQTTPNLRVDLVVSEPLVADPVAIDFGLNGELWVAEMSDYPIGPAKFDATPNGQLAPGGRIRLVRDWDGDGQFDSSTIFVDKIPMPTGVTVWRKGILICAAPDILYAEDTDGDDQADVVRKLFSGFRATNIQARVNSLVYGLDGWIHGSCGGVGGTITNFKGEKFELGFRDFRIHPDTGEIEPAAGRTQQGRDRDDFGNWFGCDNLNLAFHYPLPEHYLKRNPHIVPPPNRVNIAATEDAQRLFPARADAQRFQLSGAPGTVTAACGLGVYRDSRLGAEYTGNLFVCEPVNLLVHRLVLKPQGPSFVAQRAPNEVQAEFLRSADSWFRPVQAITGPDGSIWVVDMYRFIIENPRWIPENELQGLDVRAGTMLGRIYRVRNSNDSIPPATKYAESKGKSPLGRTAADTRVYQELKLDQLAAGTNNTTADEPKVDGTDAAARISRLRFKDARRQLAASDIFEALRDSDPHLRAFGLILAEKHLPKDKLPEGLIQAVNDDDTHLRLQAAFSLGEWDDERVGPLLSKLAIRDANDPYLVAAVFSSVTRKNLTPFTASLFKALNGREPPSSLMPPFLATAVGLSDDAAIKIALDVVAGKNGEQPQVWQLTAVTILLESLAKRKDQQSSDASVQGVIKQMQQRAQELVAAEGVPEELRLAAIKLVGRNPEQKTDDANRLVQLLSSLQTPTVQVAAVEALERIGIDEVPGMLAEHFRELSPSIHPAVVDVFLGRDVWIPKLFDGIEQGTIPVSAMAANQRQEVLGHRVASVRERSSKVLAGLINSNRREVIQQYQAALDHPGDAAKGRALFMKTCSQCHRLGDIGHSVGPNLAMVATKPPAYLLQEMLDPNRNVEARYTSYIAITKDGLSRTGILASETATNLTLLGPEAKEFVIPRSEIEEIRASGKSLMPEGLEKDVPVESAADLIAFLCSVPAASKKFEGNSPEVVKAESGRVDLNVASASIIGDRIQFAASSGSIIDWYGMQDRISWTLELSEPAEYQVFMDYSCDNDSAGNGYVLEADSTTLSGHVKSTGQASKYEAFCLGSITLAAGTHRIVLRPDGGAMKGTLANLRAIHLVPAGEQFALANLNLAAESEDVSAVAKQLLDDKVPEKERQELVHKHPTKAADIVVAMTADMPNDTKEEYRRIPWIWRVAVACGKRNQVDQNRALMDVSLPKLDQPLTDWKAVVIGGGVINGVGLVGGWPRTRLDEILGDNDGLKKRWQRTLDLASKMADDEKINTGTRYDALRIVALDDRPAAFEQLKKNLPKGTHDELQMGAISGLSDVDSKEVPRLLLENLGHFNEENRALALSALVRKDLRAEMLLDAIADGRVKADLLSPPQKKALLESKNNAIRERATKLLGKS